MPEVSLKSITDSLSDALEKLKAKKARVDELESQLNAARNEHDKAKQVATEVHKTLQGHLSELIPEPNRRP